MINYPGPGNIPAIDVTVETPLVNVTVQTSGTPIPDAISVTTSQPTSPTSLLEAALDPANTPENPPPTTAFAPPNAPGPPGQPGTQQPPNSQPASAAGPGGAPGNGNGSGAQSPLGSSPAAGGSPTLASQNAGVSPTAQLAAATSTRSLDATIAAFVAQSGLSAAAAQLGNGALARVLAALALGQNSAVAGLPAGVATTLGLAAALVRQAAAATTPAAQASAFADLATLVSQRSADIAQALTQLAVQKTPADLGIAVPLWDPSTRTARADAKKAATRTRGTGDESDRDIVLPDRDPAGRPYDSHERARLALLAADPRRGYAPEGRVALSAEIEHGLRLERAPDGSCDFTDGGGGRWNAFAPKSLAGLEDVLRRMGARTNAIVSGADLDAGDRKALDALGSRLATREAVSRVLVVDTQDAA